MAINSTSVKVSWDNIKCHQRNSNISDYVVTYNTTLGERQVDVESSNQRTIVVNGLYPFSTYTFAVAGVNNNGSGPYSVEESINTGSPTST